MATDTMTNDVLIAEFMGFKKNIFEPEFYVLPRPFSDYGGSFCSCEFLAFSSDWNWIHPVVDKIADHWEFMHPDEDRILDVIVMPLSSNIQEVYKRVVKYIKWYNTQTKQ
jgi:hypothetical protein